MIILSIHILIALSSVFYTIYAFFNPSQNKLKLTYFLIGLTLATGTYLVFLKPAHLSQTCQTGLVYIAVMLIGIFATHKKLTAAKNHSIDS